MTQNELKEVLERHLHWIRKDCDGWENMRADLHGIDLSGSNLSGSNLSGCDLRWCDLRGCDLSGCDLRGSDLSGSNLSGSDLGGCDLRWCDLRGCDLRGCDLSGCDLRWCDLSGSDLSGSRIDMEILNRIFPICCPEYGAFIGWKKANGYIVKLQITDDAKRSSALDRKCRCSKAVVLAIETMDGKDGGITEVKSRYDADFVYRVGETVFVDNFDEDRKNECAPGIHFFITRQEAVNY